MSDIGHYDDHSNYPGQMVVTGDDIKFGRDVQGRGNWQARIRRGAGWFGSFKASDERGGNPLAAAYEWLVGRYTGVGYPQAKLDSVSWNATADAIDDLRLTVFVTNQQKLREHLGTLTEYYDGWFRRGLTGLLEAGYWKQGFSQAEVDALPVIGSDDLVEEPDPQPGGYEDCITECTVMFKDREHWFRQTPSATYKNPGLLRQTGQPQPDVFTGDWITDKDVASLVATNRALRFGRPGVTATLKVKLESVERIEDDDLGGHPIIGALVKVDDAALSLEIAFRVKECDYPSEEGPFVCTLTVESERAIWPSRFIQPPPQKLGNFVVEVPDIVNRKVIELPSGLAPAKGIQLTVLAQRPIESATGFFVWYSIDGGATYVRAPLPFLFGPYGTLNAAYPNTTADDDTVGFSVKLLGVDLLPTLTRTDELANNELCWFDNEIVSCGPVTALGAGIYRVQDFRARYATVKATHALNAKCYFIGRNVIVAFNDKSIVVGLTIWLKLQPFDARQAFDFNSLTAFSYTIGGGGAVPQVTGLSLTTSFVITSESAVASSIDASWNFVVSDANVVSYNVSIKKHSSVIGWVTTNVGNLNTASLKNLEPNVSYDVRVQAVNDKGDPGAWSAISTITTAAPNPPSAPTGLSVTPGVKSVGLAWTPATTPGIAQTQIGFKLLINFDFGILVTLEGKPATFTVQRDDVDLGYFYAVRHLNNVGVPSDWTPTLQGIPLTAIGKQCDAPMIAIAPGETGIPGDDDFRVYIRNRTPGATIFYSFDQLTWLSYSTRGNYQSPNSTSMPTGNIGAISMAQYDAVFTYAIKDGLLQSKVEPFYNNASNTPAPDGTGGGPTNAPMESPNARLP